MQLLYFLLHPIYLIMLVVICHFRFNILFDITAKVAQKKERKDFHNSLTCLEKMWWLCNKDGV